jgi:hypothetical protein
MKAKISESEFQNQVIAFAKLNRWRVAHFRKVQIQRRDRSVYWETPVAADGKGFPDLLLLKEHRIMVVELKVGRNAATPEQSAWLAAFDRAHVEVHVWYPEEWPEIERVLSL